MGPLPAMVEDMAGDRALARVFAGQGLPLELISDLTVRIPLESMHSLFESAARGVGDDDFGLRVGLRMDPYSYGDWGAYVSGGQTLAGSMRRVMRTTWIQQSGTKLTLETSGSHVVWRYVRSGIGFEGRRHHSEHLLPTFIHLIRTFLGQNWRPAWLELDYPRPRRSSLEEVFDTQLRYEMPALGIALCPSALTTRRASEIPRDRLVSYTDVSAAAVRHPNDQLGYISDLIGLRLIDGKDDVDGLARHMAVSTRSLQRLLMLEGVTYRGLLDRVRLRRASEMLIETENSVTDIALSLGYQSPGNFTRAFRNWTGAAPTQFRTQCTASMRP
jgi:AraC-like DNA-binding protein